MCVKRVIGNQSDIFCRIMCFIILYIVVDVVVYSGRRSLSSTSCAWQQSIWFVLSESSNNHFGIIQEKITRIPKYVFAVSFSDTNSPLRSMKQRSVENEFSQCSKRQHRIGIPQIHVTR